MRWCNTGVQELGTEIYPFVFTKAQVLVDGLACSMTGRLE